MIFSFIDIILIMRFPINLRYLHEKPLPRYPLWYPDNPRTRLFLPLFWLRVVKHNKPLPKDFIKFECHWQMTVPDVKQYLEKLYGVSVLDVKTEIKKGEFIKHPKFPKALSPPMDDRKYAFVQLKDDVFEYPDIFKNKDPARDLEKEQKQMQNEFNKSFNKSKDRLDIGNWFF
jgi:large subunit ribosomal protein L23